MITAAEMKEDYDWQAAFHEAYHGQCRSWSWGEDGNPEVVDMVEEVLHADEGENDGLDWIAIVKWSGEEGPFAVMSAGCDYTGWD